MKMSPIGRQLVWVAVVVLVLVTALMLLMPSVLLCVVVALVMILPLAIVSMSLVARAEREYWLGCPLSRPPLDKPLPGHYEVVAGQCKASIVTKVTNTSGTMEWSLVLVLLERTLPNRYHLVVVQPSQLVGGYERIELITEFIRSHPNSRLDVKGGESKPVEVSLFDPLQEGDRIELSFA